VNNTPSELRALDLLMAEKVMGWKRVWRLEQLNSNAQRFCDHLGECYAGDSQIVFRPFQPTRHSADAMMVLKKVSNEREVIIYHLEGKFYAGEGKTSEDCYTLLREVSTNCAPTLELAICLFAKEVAW
jgi:hypothetical protein